MGIDGTGIRPGFIKIGVTHIKIERWNEEGLWEGWDVHRHRFVEDPVLAETLIWELLDQPRPSDHEPIKIDLSIAEQAFRDLIHQMYHEIASKEINRAALGIK